MIHEDRFDHIPQEGRRARAWVKALQPFAESRIALGATVPLDAFRRYHHLGDAILVAFREPAQTLERTGRIAAVQGLDHLVLRAQAKGRALIGAPGHAVEASPGDLAILDLSQPLTIETDAGSGVAIVLPRRTLGEVPDDVVAPHGQVLPGGRDPVAKLVARHLTHLAGCLPAPPPLSGHLVRATLDMCRGILGRIRVGAPLETEETALGFAIRRYVEANLATVDVADLAARFGLSRAVLYRRFPGPGGIAAYIRDRRLAEAMRRLRTTEGERPRLARLSHGCGFDDPRVFSRAFHRKYGVWPGQVCRASVDAGPATSPSQPMAWLSEL